MRRAFVCGFVLALGLVSLSGCSEEPKNKKEIKIDTPAGKTTITTEEKGK